VHQYGIPDPHEHGLRVHDVPLHKVGDAGLSGDGRPLAAFAKAAVGKAISPKPAPSVPPRNPMNCRRDRCSWSNCIGSSRFMVTPHSRYGMTAVTSEFTTSPSAECETAHPWSAAKLPGMDFAITFPASIRKACGVISVAKARFTSLSASKMTGTPGGMFCSHSCVPSSPEVTRSSLVAKFHPSDSRSETNRWHGGQSVPTNRNRDGAPKSSTSEVTSSPPEVLVLKLGTVSPDAKPAP
jgi:hypothetical protein